MNKDDLYRSFGELDDDILERSERRKRPMWIKWAALAACLCLLLSSVLLMNQLPKIITHHAGTDQGKYPYPPPGEYYCYMDVNDARAHYAGQNVKFMLSFYVCKADGEDLSDEERIHEYQRLADLGYELCVVETWAYEGNMEKVYYPVVVGLFSEEDLVTFQTHPSYGYAFRFERNGDGSALSVDDAEEITQFETEIFQVG